MRWQERNGVRWLEAELPGARALFTGRRGGVSPAPFNSLNLGLLTGDDAAAVRRNRKRLSEALGLDPGSVVIGRQVHGAEVAEHQSPQEPGPWMTSGVEPPEVDGHRTSATDLALLVFVADCLPIAVAGEHGVAMLHGGWRPLAAGIAGHGLRELGARAAAIGPGIGPCCYEVGDEVLAAFSGLGPGFADGRMLDLTEVARRLLEREGVERIEKADICTRCNPDLFFSHRGQGPQTGRQAGLVVRAG